MPLSLHERLAQAMRQKRKTHRKSFDDGEQFSNRVSNTAKGAHMTNIFETTH